MDHLGDNHNEDHALDSRSEDVFIAALELPAEAREGYLQQQEPSVAAAVRQLLAEFNQFDALVENQAETINDSPTSMSSLYSDSFGHELGETPLPKMVGPYTVLKKVGQGGMGTVYLAQQEKPRRRVALKIVPKRQVSKQFLARFESEYQALALMNHPHIAQLFDAGSTEDGNAYFCMEYIEGLPIIEYCRKKALSVSARLDLFLQLCSGMQHAHQKAIVHRDLKPSNILVAEDAGRPVAKIIDFGLAKGLANPLSDESLHTHAGALAGTPAYMSPEQLMGSPEQDTRGDIYALGVILYEMLAHCHPFDLVALRKLPLDEALRALRLEEPIKPSQQLKKQGQAAIHADLDHITLKAMAKDMSRRYPSVHALREDIEHFIHHRPVSARARTNLDVFLKFVRRNRGFIAAVATTLAALLIGLGLAVSSSIKANRAREQTQATLHFLQDVLAAPNPTVSGREVKVVELLEGAENRLKKGQGTHPELETALRTTLGNTYFGLGLYDDAIAQLNRAWQLYGQHFGENHPDTLRARYYLARVLRRSGALEEAADHFLATWDTQKRILGERDEDTLLSRAGYAMSLRFMGRHDQAEALFREILGMQKTVVGETHRDYLVSLVGLANSLHSQDKLDEAITHYQKALANFDLTLGKEAPETLATRNSLANCLLKKGALSEAEHLFRETVRLREKVLGESHSETTSSLYSLGRSLYHQKRFSEAAVVFEDVFARRRERLGPYDRKTLRSANFLARALRWAGEPEWAVEVLEGLIPEPIGEETTLPPGMLPLLQNMGDLYLQLLRYQEAVAMFKLSLAQQEQAGGKERNRAVLHMAIGLCYQGMDDQPNGLYHFCRSVELAREYFPDHERAREIENLYEAFLNRD